MFASGLQAASFMKAVQVVEYTREALAELEEDIVALSGSEDLPAHGRAVALRSEDHGAEGAHGADGSAGATSATLPSTPGAEDDPASRADDAARVPGAPGTGSPDTHGKG